MRLILSFIFNLISSSISVALVASLVIITFTINVAYLTRSKKSLFNTSMSKVLSVGYAIPGVVLAVAVIGPISFLENTLPTIFNLEPGIYFYWYIHFVDHCLSYKILNNFSQNI